MAIADDTTAGELTSSQYLPIGCFAQRRSVCHVLNATEIYFTARILGRLVASGTARLLFKVEEPGRR
jgi:hypothetical protein